MGDPPGQPRRGERHDLEPVAVRMRCAPGDPQRRGPGRARDRAGERAVSDLLGDHPDRRRGAEPVGLDARHGEHDEEQRDADPVVEAALDVEALPHPGRQPGEHDDRLAEGRVGRCEDHGEEEGLRPPEPAEERQRHDEAGDDGQRQPDAEQASGDGGLAPQGAKVDPRGVREEHDGERRLGQGLHVVAQRAQVDEPEHLRAHEQAGRGEDHGSGQRGPGDASRDGRVGEQRDGDAREGPVHRASLRHPLRCRASVHPGDPGVH